MADYDRTIGVQMQDNFDEASAALDVLLSKIDILRKRVNTITNGIQRLSTAFEALSKINNMDFSNIDNQINKMVSTVEKLEKRLSQLKTPNMNSLKSFLDSFKAFNVSSFEKMQEIPSIMRSIEAVDASKVGRVFSTLDTQISPFIQHLNEAKLKLDNFGAKTNISNLNKDLETSKKKVKDVGNEASKTRKRINQIFTVGNLIYFYNMSKQVFRGIGEIIGKAIDFTEVENYFSRAMGNMRGEAMKFQEQLSETFGLAMPDTMQMQATFKNMLGSLGGISEEMSYMLSERVTKMAIDFSSLYNTSIEQASTKFQAALSKQVRPIRSVSGYDITQNVLQATMQEIGMNDVKISQMNEIEKRLLIILTLQSQMARSAAMGDFARTIEQPANQLRVLQQQLAEVGRWIGSVFYGVIGSVLPYINGFVMAIKELVRTFALFLGYELPNSTGQTGTILDGLEEGMGGVSDSVGDINSGLDETNKKLKEAVGSLASFDKLNVIKPPTDTGSSGGGGAGGLGGMTVDPRLLEALNKYDYLFGSIRMKAMDIRDNLLQWVDAAKKFLDVNIFEKFSNSWNKYGQSVIDNLLNSSENINHILGGAFDIVGEKWGSFFQEATDLFFGLLDTASMWADNVTYFFKVVWDNGGSYLFEKLWDLAEAFLKLANSINDNFVKPVITWLKGSITPIFASLVGAVLAGVGKIVDVLANLIDWLAETEGATIALMSIAGGFYAAWKIGKLVKDFQTLGSSFTVFEKLIVLLTDNSKIAQKFFEIFTGGKKNITSFKDVYGALNGALMNTKMWQIVAKKIGEFGVSLTVSGEAVGGLAGTIKSGLGSALNWLALNPMVAVAAGIATLVAGIALLGSTQKEQKYEMEDYTESVQKQAEAADELAKSLNDAEEAAKNSYADKIGDIGTVEKYLQKLREMSGETGYVDNVNLAKMYVEEINSLLPETVQLTADGRVEWLKNTDAIYQEIAALKEEARVKAYQELYTQAVRDEIKARTDLTMTTEELNKKVQRLNELKADGISEDEIEEIGQLNADISGLNDTIGKQNEILDKTSKLQDEYIAGMEGLAGKTDEYNASLKLSYQGLSDAGNQAFNDLGTKMQEFQRQHDEYVAKGLDNNSKELKDIQSSRKLIIDEYTQQAVAYGKTYDELLVILNQQGVTLTENEKALLEKSYKNHEKNSKEILEIARKQGLMLNEQQKADFTAFLNTLQNNNVKIKKENSDLYMNLYSAYTEHGKNMNAEQQGQYQKFLTLLAQHNIDVNSKNGEQYLKTFLDYQKNGNESGEAYIASLSTALGDKTGKVSKKADDVSKNAKRIIESKKPKINVDIPDVSGKAWSAWSKVNEIFRNNTIKVTLHGVMNGVSIATNAIGSLFGRQVAFATGGFPDVGQMFIARERGPELVGTIRGRSAVANNDQIIAGISSGVYNAVLAAMQAMGGNNSQSINLENYIVVDGKIIQKQVTKADEKHSRKTGKPLFKK